MEKLNIRLDRYNGTEIADSLSLGSLEARGYITAQLGADDDFEIHFDQEPTYVVLERVKQLMREIGGIDNAVQKASEAECAASGLHPRNYEADLAYVTVKSEMRALLRYFGTGVNTEWDELVEYRDGGWILLGTQLADFSARKV